MSRDPDGFPLDPDPLHPDDWFTDPDPRVPAPWEHQRTPARRVNCGCLWALFGCFALLWVVVVVWWLS